MVKISKEAALIYHESGRPGKIEVKPTKAYRTQTDLSLAYSPGVAYPCLEIQENPDDAYKYTDKGNLVAVISNGTAVLGLGDIGALSGKPVMEGKGLLFKIYGGIDVFDIEVAEKDPEKFCEAVERIAPTFGGINLEDIKAPECFYIEDRLKKTLDIPVMHDDQHGTAIISAAGLKNAMEVIKKDIKKVKIVVNGAGAAAISCTKLYMAIGAQKENIVMLDSKGVISTERTDLNEQKKFFATSRTDIHTLAEAVKDADVFVGLSKGNVLSKDMVKSMAKDPVIFALANPVPEISYEDAMEARPDVLMSTGRTDYPNQINNVIGFPYIFRGALDVHAKAINEEMKLAAVHAIADLAKQPVPDVVNDVYKVNNLTFGRNYFIPKPVDPRLITEVSSAVAKAAIESGVARKNIEDWELSDKVPAFEKYVNSFWWENFKLGTCNSKREGEVKKNGNSSSALKDMEFICLDGAWLEATDFSKDTHSWKAGKEGESRYGDSVTTNCYVFEEGAWRDANDSDCSLELDGCTEAKEGTVGKGSDKSWYICRDNSWEEASTMEKDTYGWKDAAEGDIKKGDVTDTVYVFNGKK